MTCAAMEGVTCYSRQGLQAGGSARCRPLRCLGRHLRFRACRERTMPRRRACRRAGRRRASTDRADSRFRLRHRPVGLALARAGLHLIDGAICLRRRHAGWRASQGRLSRPVASIGPDDPLPGLGRLPVDRGQRRRRPRAAPASALDRMVGRPGAGRSHWCSLQRPCAGDPPIMDAAAGPARPRHAKACEARPHLPGSGPEVDRLYLREGREFAPGSHPRPTGPLHLGHAFSALVAQMIARRGGGEIFAAHRGHRPEPRPPGMGGAISTISLARHRLAGPVMRQSRPRRGLRAALDRALGAGLLYPCTCTRRDIAAAAAAPQEGAPPAGRPRRVDLSRHLPAGGSPRGPTARPTACCGSTWRARLTPPAPPVLVDTGAGPDGHRAAHRHEPRSVHDAQGDRRCGAGATRFRHLLPPRRGGGRRRPRHHPRRARRGPVRGDPIHVCCNPAGPADAVYHHHRLIRDDAASGWPNATTRARCPAPTAGTSPRLSPRRP